jgi:hypothetical protein
VFALFRRPRAPVRRHNSPREVQSYDNNHMTKGADDFKTIDDSRILKNSNDLSDSPTKLSKNKTNASRCFENASASERSC